VLQHLLEDSDASAAGEARRRLSDPNGPFARSR